MNFIKRNITKRLRNGDVYNNVINNFGSGNLQPVNIDGFLPAETEDRINYVVPVITKFQDGLENDILEITPDGIKVHGNIVASKEVTAYGSEFEDGNQPPISINIIDNLTSNDPDSALSANQGRILKGLIDSLGGISQVDLMTQWSDYSETIKDTHGLSAGLGMELYNKFGSYYTKTESDNKYQPIGNYLTSHQSLANYYTKTEANNTFQPKGNYLTSHQSLAGYATEQWVEDKNYLTTHQDISHLMTKASANSSFVTSLGISGNDLIWHKNGTQHNITIPYATKANQLNTSRTIWGQNFDGTANVTGAMSGVTNINDMLELTSDGIKVKGKIVAEGEISTYGDGGSSSSGGSGSIIENILTKWSDYTTIYKDTWVLSSGLGMELYNKFGSYYTKMESDAKYQPAGNYLTSHQSLANYVTLNSAQTISGRKTFVGDVFIRFDTDASNALGISWKATNGTTTKQSIMAHNTANRIILNPIGSADTWNDTVGKYSLVVGNNELKYNTYPILTSANIGSYAITSHQSLANYVTLDTEQTISGAKFFSSTTNKFTQRLEIRGVNTEHAKHPNLLFHIPGISYSKIQMGGSGNIHFLSGGDTDWTSYTSIVAQSFIKYGGTSSQFLKADGSVDSNTYLTTGTASSTYLPKSGGTMSGALNFANNTWNKVGDDASMGDCNIAGCIGIKGWNGNPGFKFYDKDGVDKGKFEASGNPLWNSNTIWHAGNDGSGSGLDADLLDGVHNGELKAKLLTYKAYDKASEINFDYIAWTANGGCSDIPALGYSAGMTIGNSVARAWQIFSSRGNSHIIYRNYKDDMTGWDNDNIKTIAFTSDNVASATKLLNTRTIWGQNFNGEGNVSGNMTGVGSITASGNIFTSVTSATDMAFRAANANGSIELLTSTNRGVYDRTNTTWLIATNGTNSWLPLGNVGIGTTSPTYKLDVNGSIRAINSWLRTTGANGWYNETYQGGWYMTDTSWVRTYNNKSIYAGTGTIRTDGEIHIGNAGSKFKVNNNGDISIGSNSSIKKTTNGLVLCNDTADSEDPRQIIIGDDGDFYLKNGDVHLSSSQWLILDEGRTNNTVNNYYFRTGATLMFGNNTAPTTNQYNAMVSSKTTSGYFWGINQYNDTFGIYISRAAYTVNNSTVWNCANGDLKHTGNFICTSEITAYSSSDKRLKENIRPIEDATNKLMKLNPVIFNWNDKAKELNEAKDDRNNYGLIAQEVEEVIPELVHEIYGEYKSLDYEQLISILIKSNQELKQKNDELEERITKIEKLINNG